MTCVLPDTLGRVGALIGEGGQAAVYELDDRPGLLLKRYTTNVNPPGLEALVSWATTLGTRDRMIIGQATAWPLDVVQFTDGWGVLITQAPARFHHAVEGQLGPRTLDFAYCNAARFAGLDPATPRTAIELTFRLAQVLDVMHRNGVVYGDLSGQNVFWAQRPRPSVYVIDCDSAWYTAGPRGLSSVQTQLWDDPWPSDGTAATEKRRDLYKLGLAFLRLYYHAQVPVTEDTPALTLPAQPLLSKTVYDLLWRSLRREGQRPEAFEWLDPLRRLDRHLRLRQSP